MLWSADFIQEKPRGSLAKLPPKGYPAIWTVGSDPNSPDLKGGGQGRLPAGEESRAVAPWPEMAKLTGVF
jgi:hypothetical protein